MASNENSKLIFLVNIAPIITQLTMPSQYFPRIFPPYSTFTLVDFFFTILVNVLYMFNNLFK